MNPILPYLTQAKSTGLTKAKTQPTTRMR